MMMDAIALAGLVLAGLALVGLLVLAGVLILFRIRLSRYSEPGFRPWLESDSGTEQVVETTPEPFEAVQVKVRRLVSETRRIPQPTARIVAWWQGVYAVPSPTGCGSLEEAAAVVSRSIAKGIASDHKCVQDYGIAANVHTVSLFGNRSGILYQRVSAQGRKLEQQCFLISPGYSVQCYLPYSV